MKPKISKPTCDTYKKYILYNTKNIYLKYFKSKSLNIYMFKT